MKKTLITLLLAPLALISCVSDSPSSMTSPTPSSEKAFRLGAQYFEQGNYAKAVEVLAPAAEHGDGDSQTLLGLCYECGKGVPRSASTAFAWYSKAAAAGFMRAQYLLATLYYKGEGVAKNYEQAAMWYRKSADNGYALSQVMLGACYALGRGVPKDYDQAFILFRKAAEQGNDKGQCFLAFCYYKGIGVDKSVSAARSWYRKSAAQGNQLAKRELRKLSTPKKSPAKPTGESEAEDSVMGTFNTLGS